MKERWFNYRPICLSFVFALLGTLFSFYLSKFLPVALSISIVVFVLLFVLAVYKRKPLYFVVPLIAFLVGVSYYFIGVQTYDRKIDYIPNKITCRLCQVKTDDGVLIAQADNVYFNDKKDNSNIYVYIYDDTSLFENLEIGSIVEIKPKNFYKIDLFSKETPNSRFYQENLKYSVTTSIDDVRFIEIDKTFTEIVRERIKNNLDLSLTQDNKEIAYSALFGDKTSLPEQEYDLFRMSGIAHLLAVSGLHVGIVVEVLCFILRKFKEKYRLLIILPILFFYSLICNFSVSVVRACVMAIVLMLSNIFGKEYDIYNSISIAGIVLFIFNPFILFDISFQMSFLCVFGIAVLYKPIRAGLIKMKFNDKVASACSMTLSCTLAVMIVVAYYFNTFNAISILSNLIIIPIFSIIFAIIFIVAFASLLIPYLVYILYPINYIMNFISILANIFGGLRISNFATNSFNFIAIVLYFVLILLIGRLCTAKRQYKILITLPVVTLLVLSMVL